MFIVRFDPLQESELFEYDRLVWVKQSHQKDDCFFMVNYLWNLFFGNYSNDEKNIEKKECFFLV